ncbi:hypothetical protein KP509_17G023000 [Ceratopteris richardii]|uniref:BHLH domain-containing protein n=1 Tax=Ceratopteris richardii TaxID=49495 RepID=A0A8T2SUR3_CERRI|nr:hypothetical protein KP509_17G023000 [Ceratopteris richardii]
MGSIALEERLMSQIMGNFQLLQPLDDSMSTGFSVTNSQDYNASLDNESCEAPQLKHEAYSTSYMQTMPAASAGTFSDEGFGGSPSELFNRTLASLSDQEPAFGYGNPYCTPRSNLNGVDQCEFLDSSLPCQQSNSDNDMSRPQQICFSADTCTVNCSTKITRYQNIYCPSKAVNAQTGFLATDVGTSSSVVSEDSFDSNIFHRHESMHPIQRNRLGPYQYSQPCSCSQFLSAVGRNGEYNAREATTCPSPNAGTPAVPHSNPGRVSPLSSPSKALLAQSSDLAIGASKVDQSSHTDGVLKKIQISPYQTNSIRRAEPKEGKCDKQASLGVPKSGNPFQKTRIQLGMDSKTVKRKRKRTRSRKNTEELESQRMTHIAVERNRRRQMNQHLNALRSLMPSSYIQRGDQASIVGGAIRFVEELEQVAQSLRLQMQLRGSIALEDLPAMQTQILPFPEGSYACSQSPDVNVEVLVVSPTSVIVKVLVTKRPHQLLRTLHAFNFLSLKVRQLKITSLEITILYSFDLEVCSITHVLSLFFLRVLTHPTS